MSARDNQPGTRWNDVISAKLSDTDFGILCLTRNNLQSTWVHYEAGALGKAIDRGRVVPLLHQVSFADVEPPLAQFHMTRADEDGIRAMIGSLNKGLERPMPVERMNDAFTGLWPILRRKLDAVRARDVTPTATSPSHRDDRELLEEMLQMLRSLQAATTHIGGDDPVTLSVRGTSPASRAGRPRLGKGWAISDLDEEELRRLFPDLKVHIGDDDIIYLEAREAGGSSLHTAEQLLERQGYRVVASSPLPPPK